MVSFVESTAKHVKGIAIAALLVGAAMSSFAAAEPLAKLNNGEVITEGDFTAYMNKRVDLKPLARNFWGVENALREQLMTRMLVLEGQRINEPNRGGEKPDRFDDTYGHKVYVKLATACPKPADDAAARKFYDQHPEAFTAPASIRLARVMLPVAEKVNGTPAMAWLMDQAQDVAKGATSFEKIAGKAETIYKLEPQGDLGWVNLTGEVPIMRALDGAKPGEMVGPVREGDYGYLFVVGDKREAKLLKWDEVKSSAGTRQVTYCRQQANKELSEKLYKQYGVVINNDAIKALFKIPVRPSPSASAAKAAK